MKVHAISRLHDQAIIKQTSSKYEAYIKHSLREANIKQTLSKRRANIEPARRASFIV